MEVALDRPDILLPDAQVMEQVTRALAKLRLDVAKFIDVGFLETQRPVAQVPGSGKHALEEAINCHEACSGKELHKLAQQC